ncbi:pyridine nucleotide-disulfide oxidoreductase [Candidatus Uhrbacteria bacterium]|nr:pyridine nucleotide-disulfide oxidoreductase [Candidatus Uhrbacteria bacterium]
MYDCIIIGGGPAGMAASVYLARQKINFLLLAGNLGGQTIWSSQIENYLGFHLLDGPEMVKKFTEHLNDYEDIFEMKKGEFAADVQKVKDGFKVTTAKGEYKAKTILVATGTKHRELDVPGEQEFKNKGVTYCATCDAPLFKDKQCYVVGGGNNAMEAALFLSKYTDKITILSINPELEGEEVLIDKVQADPNIRFVGQAKTIAITGEEMVNGITYKDAHDKEIHESAQGVFIEIGLEPITDFINIVDKNKWNEIEIDKSNATSEERIWAAGDCTDVTEKQIAVAVGEGSKASLQIIKYLQSEP